MKLAFVYKDKKTPQVCRMKELKSDYYDRRQQVVGKELGRKQYNP